MSKETTAGIRQFTFADAEKKVDNDIYMIEDLNIQDSKGRIVFTISITTLKLKQQTRGHDHPAWEVYEFVEGTGIMQIDDKALFVNAGEVIFVEPNRFHKVVNTSNASNLVFRCYAMGKINRPHLAVPEPKK